eukprot:2636119-Ditylum_brightwellii.AAC.1
MILRTHSNASYLSEKKAQSRTAGYFYLGKEKVDKTNGLVLVLAKILKCVMASAAEAECSGLYQNGREAIPLRMTLEEMGHPQPAIPIATDNTTVEGIMNTNVQQKQSKAINMRLYWMQDRIREGQFMCIGKQAQAFSQLSKQASPASLSSKDTIDVHTQSAHSKHEVVTRKLASMQDSTLGGTETQTQQANGGTQENQVWMDQNNLSVWDTSSTSNWQWTPAVVIYYSDTPPSVTCAVANRPYQKHPTVSISWQMTKTFNVVDVNAIEADKCVGIDF